MSKVCDIIIPIYNAFEDTVECIDSVLKKTGDSEGYRLILINDKSPDERIKIYLDELDSKKISSVVVLHNEENLGFVKTCNRGMALSEENDVVLLNSDTVVTENWLKKIKNCAYMDGNIATVTPLCNNGTIASVPVFDSDNELPENLTLEEYSELIERISLKKYPVMPTGVGFCMYIKRTVIKEIGVLDAEAFGKGYGEENDFCCRAIEHGYVNVLCDDTFIYHKGSMSFKEDKKEYIENNLKILFSRYPYYPKMVESFLQANPLKDIQENVKLYLKIYNGKKNILYILHNGVNKEINNPVGGTEFHVLDLINNISDYNKFVLVSTGSQLILSAFIGEEVLDFKFSLSEKIDYFSFHSKRYEEIFRNILSAFNISLVHIQHLRHHTLDAVKCAKDMNIPVAFTLHDFYTVCPRVNLLDTNAHYCADTRDSEMCSECIKKEFGFNTDFLKTWNVKMKEVLKACDRLYAPSESARRIILDYYKDDQLDIKVIEHGTETVQHFDKKPGTAGKFNIAFIGGMAPYKGSGMAHDLIVKNKDKDIQWYIFGNLGDQRLNLLERKNLTKYGRYERENIYRILNDNSIDLVCILSLWPETYSYTLTEAWQAGIPVLVSNMGALKDRVESSDAGWVLDIGKSPETLLEEIYKIKNDKKEYARKLENVGKLKLKSNKEMEMEYKNEYAALTADKADAADTVDTSDTSDKADTADKEGKKISHMDAAGILTAYKIGSFKNLSANESEAAVIMELSNKIESLQNELNAVKGTFGWKLLDVLRQRSPKIVKVSKKILYHFAKKQY